MIKLKKLLPEENKKSKYELLMDLIDDFLELRDGFETRMIDIEKKLKELKKMSFGFLIFIVPL